MIKYFCKMTKGHIYDPYRIVKLENNSGQIDVNRKCKKCGHLEMVGIFWPKLQAEKT